MCSKSNINWWGYAEVARGVAHGTAPAVVAAAPLQGRGELRGRPPTTRTRRWRGCRCAHRRRPGGTTVRSGGPLSAPWRRRPFGGAGNCAAGHRLPAPGVGEGAAAPAGAAPAARLSAAAACLSACSGGPLSAPWRRRPFGGAGNCATDHRLPAPGVGEGAAVPTGAAPAARLSAAAACLSACSGGPLSAPWRRRPFRGAGNCAAGHRPPAPGVGEGAAVPTGAAPAARLPAAAACVRRSGQGAAPAAAAGWGALRPPPPRGGPAAPPSSGEPPAPPLPGPTAPS